MTEIRNRYLTVQDLEDLALMVRQIIFYCNTKNPKNIKKLEEFIKTKYGLKIKLDKKDCNAFLDIG
jgi:accessory colonization factor AcfC